MLEEAATAPMFLIASAICAPVVLKTATVCAIAPENAFAHSMSVMFAMIGLKMPYPVVKVPTISWMLALVALAVSAAMAEKVPTASSERLDSADFTS